MFRPGDTWYHESTLDIGLTVLKVQYRGPTYIKVIAVLANRHNGLYYETATYTIQRSQLGHWKLWSTSVTLQQR